MKFNFKVGLALSSVVLLSGCNTTHEFFNKPLFQMEHRNLSASDMLSNLATMDRGEMSISKLAQQKAHHPEVKKYATYLYREHDQNLKETMKVSKKIKAPIQNSPMTADIQNRINHTTHELQAAHGPEFDKKYIHDMIKCHKHTLHCLDNDIAQATDPMLRKHLEMTRMHVREHLKRAEHIREMMMH